MSASRTVMLTFAWLLVSNPCAVRADTPLDGEILFRLACQACHALGPETPYRIGPPLTNIADKPAGTATDYPYSVALRQSGLVWNRPTLVAWITGAERLVPGTLMAHHNTLQAPEALRLAEYLTRSAPRP
ncbi:MAG: c-type cytochrome [Steroidobacteraceae bacterium]